MAPTPSALPPMRVLLLGAIALIAWTVLFGLIFSPDRFLPSSKPRERFAPPSQQIALPSDEEHAWMEKLLGDLEASSDGQASATIAELRKNVHRRAPAATASPVTAEPSRAEVPKYDPKSVDELRAAASAARLPDGDGAVPQLLRDMSRALSLHSREEDELRHRLATLSPAVKNYNPRDIEQLSEAAKQATSPADVSGALPNLLRDLSGALIKQRDEQRGLGKQLELADKRRAREAANAKRLREMVVRGSNRAELIDLLFAELSDTIDSAIDEQAAHSDAAKGSDGAAGASGAWRDGLAHLQSVVTGELHELRAANASAHAQLAAAEEARREAEQNATALADSRLRSPSERVTSDVVPTAADGAAGSAGVIPGGGLTSATAGAELGVPSVDVSRSSVSPAPRSYAAPQELWQQWSPTDAGGGGVPSAGATGDTVAAASSVVESTAPLTAPTPADAPPPDAASPPPAPRPGSACTGKRCPQGYDMVDRGDRCTCRPSATQTAAAATAQSPQTADAHVRHRHHESSMKRET